MSESYIVTVKKKITRKEGNSGVIRITFPVIISLVAKSLLFQVRDERDTIILSKSTTSGITVNGQVVDIALLKTDLVGKVGSYTYELLLYDVTDESTVAEGCFVVTKKVSKNV